MSRAYTRAPPVSDVTATYTIPGHPAVRAVFLRTTLSQLDALRPSERDPVLAAIPPADLALIQRAGALAWLPGDLSFTVNEGIGLTLGRVRTRAFQHAVFRETLTRGALGGFIASMMRVVGREPERVLPKMPLGIGQLFRDFGTWRVTEVLDQRARVEFSEFPEPCLDHDHLWLDAALGAMTSVLEVIGFRGDGSIVDLDENLPSCTYELRWRESTGVIHVDMGGR
jgi:hypothetical protein